MSHEINIIVFFARLGSSFDIFTRHIKLMGEPVMHKTELAPTDFDSFLKTAGGMTLDLYGIQVDKLEFFKTHFQADYLGMKSAYENDLARPRLHIVQ